MISKLSGMNKESSKYILLILMAVVIVMVTCSKEEKAPDPVTDIDGNTYKTLKIGTQIWMAENLKTTLFNDGLPITLITDTTDWNSTVTAGYCWYNNDEASNKDTYGAIYNGFTVDSARLCPAGWHIPSLEEWQQLIAFLGDTTTAGGQLKEEGTNHWITPNIGATNSTGFTALASGFRYYDGTFASILYYTCFWSSTNNNSGNQWYTGLYYGNASLKTDYRSKKYGFSVRCIKD